VYHLGELARARAAFENGINVSEQRLAYVAQGKLHVQRNGARSTVESAFGRSLRERAVQIHNRHAWKTEGRGAQFMRGVLWPDGGGDPNEFRILITSVTRGCQPGELLYSLETDAISGVFRVDATGFEQRLFHTADYRVRHLALHPSGETIAVSVLHSNMTANLAVMNADGSDFREISEGDSLDLSPRWQPGGRRLVFQSAGLGRNAAGRFSGYGPFAAQQLDLDSGELSTLAEDPDADLLGPQLNAAGDLYYIRRPYAGKQRAVDPLGIAKDTLLFPFRMSYAIFQFFNFFSMRYTGRPLTTARGAIGRARDLKQMMIWGNLVDVERAAREGTGDSDAPSLVPSSWQLVRQSPAGKDVLAKGVLSFDLARDGSAVYSNGSAVHRIDPDGQRRERLLVGSMIEQVTLL
jgi:hypothetical protein